MIQPKYTSSGITARSRDTSSAMWPKQAKISWQRVSRGQSSLMLIAVLNTSSPLANLPKTCIAKLVPYEENLSAGSKQPGHKQSLLRHPSTYNKKGEEHSHLSVCLNSPRAYKSGTSPSLGLWGATSSGDGTLRVWSIDNWDCVRKLGLYSVVTTIAFGNGLIFSCSSDHTVKLWNVSTWECI